MSIYQSELKTLVRLSLVENVVLFWRYWCFGWCFLRLHFQTLFWKPIWSHPDPSLIFQSRILEKKPLTEVYMKWIRIFRAWTRNQNKTPKNEKLQRTIRTVQKDDPNLRTKSQFSLHVAVDGVLLLYKWLMQSVFVRSFIRSFELALRFVYTPFLGWHRTSSFEFSVDALEPRANRCALLRPYTLYLLCVCI